MKIYTKILAVVVICAGSGVFSMLQAQAAEMTPVVRDPSNLTTWVNRKIGMSNYTPQDLVPLDTLNGGQGLFIRQPAFADLKAMMDDMAAQQLPVKLNSAYRSFLEQDQLYTDGVTKDPKSGETIAKPGFSEHQLGLAVDFGAVITGPNNGFANTGQSAWLQANAYKYGFALTYPAGKEAITGYGYEPWHWRYLGKPAAAEWKQSGLVLEQFLARQPQSYVALSLIGQTVKSPSDPTVYYLNANGTKRGFIAPEAFLSYGLKWTDVLLVPPDLLLEFPETKVVKLQGNPTVYQFNKDKTRQAIASAEAFTKLNYTWTDIVEINATELSGYKVGPIIK